MIPFEWQASLGTPKFVRIAASASHLGAARFLRPIPEVELAAYIDLSVDQYVGELVSAISGVAQLLFGSIDGDPVATGDTPIVTQTGRGITRLLALDEGGTLFTDGAVFRAGSDVEFSGPLFASVPALGFGIFAAEISLQHGSLIAKFANVFVGTGAGVAAALFLLAPIYAEWHADRLANHEIIRVTEHGRCAVDFAAELDIGALRELAAHALVKPPHGKVSAVPKKRRICLTQVLLHLNNAYPGKFDGIEGDYTKQAEVAFAERVGLTAKDVGSLPFYEALIANIQPKRQ